MKREYQSVAVQGKKINDKAILTTSRNGDRKIMLSIRPPLRIRKLSQLS